jgi:hypothetical protein
MPNVLPNHQPQLLANPAPRSTAKPAATELIPVAPVEHAQLFFSEVFSGKRMTLRLFLRRSFQKKIYLMAIWFMPRLSSVHVPLDSAHC